MTLEQGKVKLKVSGLTDAASFMAWGYFSFWTKNALNQMMTIYFISNGQTSYQKVDKNCDTSVQSGTKPNLVAKILATKFGVFFCYIYI